MPDLRVCPLRCPLEDHGRAALRNLGETGFVDQSLCCRHRSYLRSKLNPALAEIQLLERNHLSKAAFVGLRSILLNDQLTLAVDVSGKQVGLSPAKA
jgi:hypothetical protein